eukprot:880850-Amphidinium_carterae.3
MLKEDDLWIITQAVYRLWSAPRLWEQSRDDVLKTCDFLVEGGDTVLRQTFGWLTYNQGCARALCHHRYGTSCHVVCKTRGILPRRSRMIGGVMSKY